MRSRRNAMVYSAFVGMLVVSGLGCGGATHWTRVCRSDALQLGLYKVVSRSCEQPHPKVEYCPLTQYIELRRGAEFGMEAPTVLVEWFAEKAGSTDYAYEVEPLHGYCTEDGHLILDRAGQGDAWLTVDEGVPKQYAFDAYATVDRRELLFRARFELAPEVRTRELDRMLSAKP